MTRLHGKIALVTGAAQGIGFAIASRFHAEGAMVVACDVNEALGVDAVRAVGSERFVFRRCDVTDCNDVRDLFTFVAEKGPLDICVSNAAIIEPADFLAIDPAVFMRVLEVNVKGCLIVGQAAGAAMKTGRGGSIINMSSGAAEVVMPDLGAYAASKGAIRQLTKVMAVALAPYNIRVNAIGPGSVETEMFRAILDTPAQRTKVLSRTPAGRIGRVEDIAGVAMFLASEDSAYVTGQTIYVDGGRLVLNYMVPVPGGEGER
ncbi:MAG: SDR family NAD(P)-dependent oxidoreductase [Parvibaculaceae bacterium]